jgi:transcriptional regulator with XRE-family HTH domain
MSKHHSARLLAEAMKAKGWEEGDLAEASGINQSLIGRYLRAEVDVGQKNAPRLAKALGIDTLKLLYGPRAA